MTDVLTIDRRFCGPPASANGGYTCGRVAASISGPAEVTLRAPPPLETAMQLEKAADGKVELTHEGSLIAEARALDFELAVPEPVSLQAAAAATPGFIGFKHHPYPTCFVCGTERPAHDGLGLHAGPVAGRPLVATVWTPAAELGGPDGRVEPHFVWCALDCPSWFGHASFLPQVPRILLGRLALRLERLPRTGEPHVVLGWSVRAEGRRILCGSALQDADGHILARALATWITLR